jgi:hypothetical protein
MIDMWWQVKMVAPGEIHVYPLSELHILNALCPCRPEVRCTSAGKMVVHKRMGQLPIKPMLQAHWVH